MRLLTFCFRNLFRRKTRTILCVLGVAIAATFVVAVGAATMRYTTVIRQINVLFNGQVIVVDKTAVVVQAIPVGGGMFPEASTVDKLKAVPGVASVTPVLFMTSVESQGLTQLVPVNFSMGIPVENFRLVLGPVPLRQNGRFPANDSSSDVVVGASMADQYDIKAGSDIEVNGYALHVSGVFVSGMALLNRCVVMPLALAQRVYNSQQSINLVAVKPLPNVSEDNLTAAIKQSVSYVNALTETQRNDIVEPVLDQVTSWTVGIEAVVFVISLILVMTVMIMSVSERRRDFATLDALGAPANYMFRVVLLEAFLIGVLGGLVGVAFGSLGAVILASFYTGIPVNMFFPTVLEIVPPLYMLEMFAAIIIVCCLGGVIPAVNAMKMRVAEVLRAEY